MDKFSNELSHKSRERTGLAEERTLAAWLRTGLTMIGVGLGVAKLLPDLTVPLLADLLGIVLITVGGVVFLLGYHTYRRSLRDMKAAGYDLAPNWLISGIIVALFLSTFMAALLMLL
jgi:putative membrane protein